jgi:5-(carboxyamino)imidazole ribonucleotide synthase
MRIGIMGGGQLGLYLCRAAADLGLHTVVLNPTADCSAATAADELLVGGLDDVAAASQLAARADVVTFEIESVAPAVLEHLARLGQDGPRVSPDPSIMLTLQNKVLQKQWLARHDFPTPDFVVLDVAAPKPADLVARFGLPLVQKAAFGGYDGRGVQILHTDRDLQRLWPGPSLVEAFVTHDQEIAVLTARALDGTLVSYPPAAMRFNTEANVLETVTCPARLPAEVAQRATELAERIVTALDGVGLFAVEMFVTPNEGKGQVQINEISPRVHNAGHLTMEAFVTSQFEQHLRAVAGLPLGDVTQTRPAVMKNVLYTPDLEIPDAESVGAISRSRPAGESESSAPSQADAAADVVVHWYGKKGVKPLRKMGHITALANDEQTAEREAQRALHDMMRGAGRSDR